MKIKKKFQGALPSNKVVNTNSNSQTDTYSCDYINSMIETVENSNGKAIKFPDGTMICLKYIELINLPINTAWGNLFMSEQQDAGDFAVPFISSPCITSGLKNSYAAWISDTSETSATSVGKIRICKATNSTGSFYINIIAIGRWK